MASCERCGLPAPSGARYCAACGHRVGEAPEQPVVTIEVRQSASDRGRLRGVVDGCLGCFSWIVVAVLVVLLVSWLLSC